MKKLRRTDDWEEKQKEVEEVRAADSRKKKGYASIDEEAGSSSVLSFRDFKPFARKEESAEAEERDEYTCGCTCSTKRSHDDPSKKRFPMLCALM